MHRRSPPRRPRAADWRASPARAELHVLYAEADRLVAGWTCACAVPWEPDAPQARCCHFAVTGREPYPTAVELEEVHYAMRARSVTPRDPRVLPLADARPCPLLSETGQCRIYASRPFGCRTFFCDGAEAPLGEKAKLPREALNALGRRIADLSARFAPHDPHPRPLVRALSSRKG